ncbi:MAG: DUF4230 domain-containing protein [Lentisphaerae bacterium]|nr:DUF4230 domain-containing protein [Lentisphaerota bacterium]
METVFTIGIFAMGLFFTAILIIGLAICRSVNRNKPDNPKNIADDLKLIFSQIFPAVPNVSANGSSVAISGSICKDHVVDRTSVEADAYFENKRFLSKKTLSMSGKFRVHSGFPADSYFSIAADSGNRTVTASIPDIQILKIEPAGKISDSASNGWWNRLSDKDRSEAMEMLRQNASEQAGLDGVVEKAEKAMAERIRDAFSSRGYRVFIRHGDF